MNSASTSTPNTTATARVRAWPPPYKMHGGERMIWYASESVRLFRRNPGEADWTFAINRLVKAMK